MVIERAEGSVDQSLSKPDQRLTYSSLKSLTIHKRWVVPLVVEMAKDSKVLLLWPNLCTTEHVERDIFLHGSADAMQSGWPGRLDFEPIRSN